MLSRQEALTFCLSQSCKDPVYFLYNLYIQICKDMPCVLVHVFLGRVTAPTRCVRQGQVVSNMCYVHRGSLGFRTCQIMDWLVNQPPTIGMGSWCFLCFGDSYYPPLKPCKNLNQQQGIEASHLSYRWPLEIWFSQQLVAPGLARRGWVGPGVCNIYPTWEERKIMKKNNLGLGYFLVPRRVSTDVWFFFQPCFRRFLFRGEGWVNEMNEILDGIRSSCPKPIMFSCLFFSLLWLKHWVKGALFYKDFENSWVGPS